MTQTLEERLEAAIRTVQDFPKPGIGFKDITPIFADPALVRDTVTALALQYATASVTVVIGIESRGFLLGPMVAQALGARFVPLRKQGKLPYETVSYSYDLEYGSATIEMHTDAVFAGEKVLIHDDLLATGGTAAAAAELVKKMGAEVAGFSFLINLAFLPGESRLSAYGSPVHALVSVLD